MAFKLTKDEHKEHQNHIEALRNTQAAFEKEISLRPEGQPAVFANDTIIAAFAAFLTALEETETFREGLAGITEKKRSWDSFLLSRPSVYSCYIL